MPFVVAIGLGLLAIGNLDRRAARRSAGARERRSQGDRADPRRACALIAIIGLGGGFILATSVLFAATSAAFGRRAILVDLAIGLVLAVVIYLLFDKLLTLSLPAGPLERLL